MRLLLVAAGAAGGAAPDMEPGRDTPRGRPRGAQRDSGMEDRSPRGMPVWRGNRGGVAQVRGRGTKAAAAAGLGHRGAGNGVTMGAMVAVGAFAAVAV
jgi:hypothetical protein